MANGESTFNGAFNGMPAWVKIVATLGFPIFIAIFLLGMLTGAVPSPLAENQKVIFENNRILMEFKDESETQVRLLRAICRSVANTEFSRAECER